MKKYFVIALAALSMSMVSCKNEETKKAEAFFEQIDKAGEDPTKIVEIAGECQAWFNGLSDEQKGKLSDQMKSDLNKLFEMTSGIQNNLETIEEGMEVIDAAADSMDEAAEVIDEAGEAVEEAIEEAVEE